MPSSASTVNYAAALTTIWPQEDVEEQFLTDFWLYAMMPKDTDWDGEARVIDIIYGATNGRSSTFANAKANKKQSKVKKMTIFTADEYSLWSVDHKLARLSRNNKGAVIKALTQESKSAIEKLKRAVQYKLWGDGGGSCGGAQIGSFSTNNITLTDRRKARMLEEGDVINLAVDNGYTAQAGVKAGTLEVSAVNRKTGVITFTQNVTAGIPTAANSDFIFIDGDYAVSLKGVEFYVPSNDPGVSSTPTTIWGMLRTADPVRLAGLRGSATGLQIQEAIKAILKEAKNEECKADTIALNPDNYLDLELDLGSRVRYVDTKVGNVGFSGIVFTSHGGKTVECYADPDCPYNTIRGFDFSGWTFASPGAFPDFLSMDGGRSLRTEDSTNSGEGRMGGYPQAYTERPRDNFVLQIS